MVRPCRYPHEVSLLPPTGSQAIVLVQHDYHGRILRHSGMLGLLWYGRTIGWGVLCVQDALGRTILRTEQAGGLFSMSGGPTDSWFRTRGPARLKT